MPSNPRSRIQDLCSQALTVTDAREIDPILSEPKAALQEKVQSRERWIELCERAAVEQDAKKLLELVSEINRLFEAREERLAAKSESKLPGQ